MALLNTNKNKLVEVSPNNFKKVGYIMLYQNQLTKTTAHVRGICYDSKEQSDSDKKGEEVLIHFGDIELTIQEVPDKKMHELALAKLGTGFEIVGLQTV